jgi:hypothetical protein
VDCADFDLNSSLTKLSASPALKALSKMFPNLPRLPGAYAAFFSEHNKSLRYCKFSKWQLVRDIWEEGSGWVGQYFPDSSRWIGAKVIRTIDISKGPLRLWQTSKP